MRYITLPLALLALSGCIVIENTASTGITTAPESDTGTEPPSTSSFGPVDPTTGPGLPDSNSTTGQEGTTSDGSSSTDAGSSTGSTSDSSSSTGDPGEIIDSCEFGEACPDGVCAPNGACVSACMADGRCAGDELCLGGGCIDVGADMQEAQVVALNDSPVGVVSKYDVDVWKVKLFKPGSYTVMVSGEPISAYILNGAGDIVATPASAVDVGDMTAYTAQLDDVSVPMVVLLMSGSPDFVPYFFYTTKNS